MATASIQSSAMPHDSESISRRPSESVMVEDFEKTFLVGGEYNTGSKIRCLEVCCERCQGFARTSQKSELGDVDFAPSVDEIILDKVYSDEELLRLFVILLFTSSTAIGHRMYPSEKSQLVKQVKVNFSCKLVAMGIDSPYAEIAMLQQAGAGIGIAGEEDTHIFVAAEFSAQDCGQLKYLIFKH